MGSNLHISIDRQFPNGYWAHLFNGRAVIDRGPVVDAFGDCDPEAPIRSAAGYLTHEQWVEEAKQCECPWYLDEPYWVRLVDGAEFASIIREKRWQQLQDG